MKITGIKDRLTEEEKEEARSALETLPPAESDASAALSNRAEGLLARLHDQGKRNEATEIAGLLSELDHAPDAAAANRIVDHLVDWIYEHADD